MSGAPRRDRASRATHALRARRGVRSSDACVAKRATPPAAPRRVAKGARLRGRRAASRRRPGHRSLPSLDDAVGREAPQAPRGLTPRRRRGRRVGGRAAALGAPAGVQCRTAGRSSASTRRLARELAAARRPRARARPGGRGRARSAGERSPSASSSTAARAAVTRRAARRPAAVSSMLVVRPSGPSRRRTSPARHEAVDEPHGARRGQAEDAPQAVDRAAVGEVLERRQRRGRRQGLIGGRGDGVGHLIGDDERQRAEDVAVAAQRGHRATRSRSRARPRPSTRAERRTRRCP